MTSIELVQCYNRGCGEKYNPEENNNDSCQHHPGEPFFHDAYKGWSCCNKKCTDFTEFLNIKGCTTSKHSNVKPPEPEKPVHKDIPDFQEVEIKPLIQPTLQRPPFDSTLTEMKPEIAPSLKQQLTTNTTSVTKTEESNLSTEITIGTLCKNNNCNRSYDGPETDLTACVYHPGVPIFHEGLKYWSCCTKRTSDFNEFLSQIGCTNGKHVWINEESNSDVVNCRWDYHQTGSHVIVTIYAKQYCPNTSVVKLNPIRLYANLTFPQQSNAFFNMDIELRGIVKVEESNVQMFGTKVEIKMKKAEPGSWSQLEIPRIAPFKSKQTVVQDKEISSRVEGIDLSDL